MNWIDLAWPAMGGACLLLAVTDFAIWIKRRDLSGHLYLAVLTLMVAAVSVLELGMMQTTSIERYATLLRWVQPFTTVMVIAIVLLVLREYRVGRPWLGIAACLVKVAALFPDFLTGVNINFQQITALHPVRVWGGEMVSRPEGVANPWMLLLQFNSLLVLAFLLDAFVLAWKQAPGGSRERALQVTGSLFVFALALPSWTAAIVHGLLDAPMVFTPLFMCVVLAISYEIGRDVLGARQLAAELAGSEASRMASELRMEAAVGAAGIGLWSYDPGCDTILLDPRGRSMIGAEPEERIDSESFRKRVHPDDLEDVQAMLARAGQEDGEYRGEFRVLDTAGGVRWLAAVGRMEQGGSGRSHGVLLDITERRLEEDRFRRVINASPTAMLVVEADGHIRFASDEAERVFGYSPDQLAGMNVDQLVPAAQRAGHAGFRADYARHAFNRRMAAGRELFGLRRDGSEVPLEIALNPIPSDHGLQFLASITDITERRQKERDAATQRDELAHLSRVALLSELSGSLAHELNQPLTAILSNAQAATRFLAHSPPNLEEVRESLLNIVESDKRAGEVIRRLRAMLRKDPPDFQRLDLNEVVRDVLRIIRSDLLNRNTETRLEFTEPLPLVHGDRVQLQQVLLNLIMNGTDAMLELAGGRTLTVRTLAHDSGAVEVQVADVGRGIPEAELERIFSPFVTTKSEGMGLGLAVCTTIAEGHRGRLWASNNPGGGATLHLMLPGAEPVAGH